MRCNLCGSEQNGIIWDKTRFERNNVLECKACGMVFLELRKNKAELEEFYKDEYRKVKELPEQTPEELYNDPVTRKDCADRIKWIGERYGGLEGKKVLEIGSASGYFLETMASRGADATGVELTKSYSEYSRKLGFTVHSKPFEELGLKEEFDLVVMFHTLEHVYDPMGMIKAIHRSLREGGKFMGEVPNQDDWRISVFGNETAKLFHYDPNHYHFFSPKTLGLYLERAGFGKMALESVERYNSLRQLKRILGGAGSEGDDTAVLKKDIFPKKGQDMRLPDPDNRIENEFNRLFAIGVNGELKGNCLRWNAWR